MTYMTMPLEFKLTLDDFAVPLEMQEAFWNYFMYGWEPGSFGMAILENNFFDAVLHAHHALSMDHMRGIVQWFHNTRLPRAAHGSIEKVEAWRKLSDNQRKEIMEDLRLCPTLFDILRRVPGPGTKLD